MTDDYDLDWLTEHRPQPDAPSPATTRAVRASLLSDGLRRHRRRRRARAMVGVTVLAAAVAAATALAGGAFGTAVVHRGQPTVAVVPPAGAAPDAHPHAQTTTADRPLLVGLAVNVRRMRRLPGNATLVVYHDVVAGGSRPQNFWSVNLYTDGGTYYWSSSMAGLRDAIVARRTQHADISPHGLSVIARAAGDSPQAARRAVLSTIGGGPRWTPAERRARAQLRRSFLDGPRRERKYAPPTPREVDDSYVWLLADEALEQGAGRPDVRAAAMKALSTLQDVRQARVTLSGRPVLRVTYDRHQDQQSVWLSAAGVPVRQTDGLGHGAAVLTFHVRRVTLSHLR